MEIIAFCNSCSSLPIGLLDLPKEAELWCLMNNVFVGCDMFVQAEGAKGRHFYHLV
jgi:hypothetical protein